ncbi:MAG: hypothetical protein WCO56_26410 [Verrucomicrobiota bacterium]
MNASVITCLILLLLCGCSTPPAGAPTDLGDGFRRDHHPAFTIEEQQIITAARQYLEQSYGKRMDAYYRVWHEPEGYVVMALEVYQYDKKKPRFRVGSDFRVILRKDGTVSKVIPGM